MKKGYFVLSDESFNCNDHSFVGVHKKIKAQRKAFEMLVGTCDFINLLYERKKNIFINFIYHIFSKKLFLKYVKTDCEYLYIRRVIPVTRSFIFYLKKQREMTPNVKIIYELPTYPYDAEVSSLRERILLSFDKLYRRKLKKYVDLITTFSKDNEIFKIRATTIVNGIDCTNIGVSKRSYSDEIKLIAVAQFAKWHGYDRVIKGLASYYKNNNYPIVKIDFVGNGDELQLYKKMVNDYQLTNYVTFCGELFGESLQRKFDEVDIALNSLGCHRKKIFLSSELKSREYLARGIPSISSTKIDIIPEKWKYNLYVPENDNEIDINKIVSFYQNLLQKETVSQIHANIRNYAEKNCEMNVVMRPIFEYIGFD